VPLEFVPEGAPNNRADRDRVGKAPKGGLRPDEIGGEEQTPVKILDDGY